ncbi:hypothetical protein Patl1_15562 [Pistacia atlantica]|uniref:Uncharacterized protein n=1 Tax=Pistacia atlantica TaxID=434234 RepID=A0ACC1B8F2_9ROSI|nr:hypothetical protein Patl1_15562 [Pistacia atlantica]
MDSHSKSA